uniref:Uncharacterized protein n=1 Tax=Chromera velia CCMP2878 TaxID=1169474 RepID=A0A0G4GE19_9ALVE|eukprot:Cvel_4571.t1-p1 / transcript=Cvel_4571.t1 / gene=Cvel_4571 / organism=Chromera_velia_CCMP2878 / gene_product=hypothetical protein / transcript_product=hypothetical protein / location=Cvel_scaffold200:113188-114438(-) / protein_length=417 / sequence_SO=supercontig / SO=protein_coding / is_pseudo=false
MDFSGLEITAEKSKLFELALEGPVALVKVDVLQTLLEKTVAMCRRDEMEVKYPELYWKEGDEVESATVAALSYPWQTKLHPDPCNVTAHRVVAYLREHHKGALLFWDFLSLHSRVWDPELQRKTVPGKEGREFKTDLALYYGNMSIDVMTVRCPWGPLHKQLQAVSERNERPYSSRGWCFFESCASALKGYNDHGICDLPQTEDDGVTEADTIAQREWNTDQRVPVSPKRFRQKLLEESAEGKSVLACTNQSDPAWLIHLYTRLACRRVGEISILDLSNIDLSVRKRLDQLIDFLSFMTKLGKDGQTDAEAECEDKYVSLQGGKASSSAALGSSAMSSTISAPLLLPLGLIFLCGCNLDDPSLDHLFPVLLKLSPLCREKYGKGSGHRLGVGLRDNQRISKESIERCKEQGSPSLSM